MDEITEIICRELVFFCNDGRLNLWFVLSIIPFLGIIFALTILVGYGTHDSSVFWTVPLTVLITGVASFLVWIAITGSINLWIESEVFRIIVVACGLFLMIGYAAFFFAWARDKNGSDERDF